jgi:5-methylcytosine-specific restriction endonuclease McrA
MEPRTLVLNSWARPHQIVSWQTAICLVDILVDGRCIVVGKADTLETYDATVSSPSVTIKIPAVIRLRKDIDRRKGAIKFSRTNVYSRDGWKCLYCGRKDDGRRLTYDHVVPRSQGGPTSWANVATACRGCNTRKGNKTPHEAGMKLAHQPYVPKSLPMGQAFMVDLDTAPPEWLPYLAGVARSA